MAKVRDKASMLSDHLLLYPGCRERYIKMSKEQKFIAVNFFQLEIRVGDRI